MIEPEPGIRCPKCGGVRWTIDETRKECDLVRRIRVCLACGERIETREAFVRPAPRKFILPRRPITTGSKKVRER